MLAISLYYHSEVTMSKVLNKIYNDKSRHTALRHEFIKQLISNGIVIAIYVRFKDNIVDPLTKGFSKYDKRYFAYDEP